MCAGAAAVLLTGGIKPAAALEALDPDVMLFLFGMFAAGQVLELSGWLAHATIGRALVTVNTSSPPLLLCSARSPWSRRPATSAEGAGSGLSTVGFAMDGAAEPTTTIVVMASSAKSSPAVAVVPCRTASIAAGVRIDSAAPAGRIDHAEATVEVVVA